MTAQFKVIKFGAKAGVNYPQASLSTQDVLSIINDQTYDISNIQTDISNGFNAGVIARISLPLIPVYVHGEALYTQFKQGISITDNGNDLDLSSLVQRLDFPLSAGAKIGPIFAGLGATPSMPLANASAIWSNDTEAQFTWGCLSLMPVPSGPTIQRLNLLGDGTFMPALKYGGSWLK